MPDKLIPFDGAKLAAAGKEPDWKPQEGAVLGHAGLATYVFRVLRVRDDGSVRYDGIARAEAGGGLFLPVDGRGRIGLIKSWRMQTQDVEAFEKSYPRIDWERVGRESYEIPGGFSHAGEKGTDAAVREAGEETGGKVHDVIRLGHMCDNRAFSVHLSTVMAGRVDLEARASNAPDPHEQLLGKLEFFTLDEIAALQREGKLYCALTLAAIAMVVLQKPDLVGVTR